MKNNGNGKRKWFLLKIEFFFLSFLFCSNHFSWLGCLSCIWYSLFGRNNISFRYSISFCEHETPFFFMLFTCNEIETQLNNFWSNSSSKKSSSKIYFCNIGSSFIAFPSLVSFLKHFYDPQIQYKNDTWLLTELKNQIPEFKIQFKAPAVISNFSFYCKNTLHNSLGDLNFLL